MGEASEAALFRMILRAKAPMLRQMFEAIASAWGEMKPNIYATFHYEKGKDIEDPKSVVSQFHSILSKKCVVAGQDPSVKISEEDREAMEEAFPVCAMMIRDKSEEWNIDVYDLFMLMRVNYGSSSAEDPDKIEVQVRTRAGIKPERAEVIS